MSNRWFPDRKIWAGGIAGVVAFFVAPLIGVPQEVLAPVVGGAILLAGYWVSPSLSDLIKRADEIARAFGRGGPVDIK